MKYLEFNNSTKHYFKTINVDCINNAEGTVNLTGSMRNVTAAISKLLRTNKGTRVQCMSIEIVKIINKEHAIVNAYVIFDLSKMVDSTNSKEDETYENKLKITKSIRLFCQKHGVICNNNAEKIVYVAGNQRDVSAVISKIKEVNKDSEVQCSSTAEVRKEKDKETGEEYAIINACIIFDNTNDSKN